MMGTHVLEGEKQHNHGDQSPWIRHTLCMPHCCSNKFFLLVFYRISQKKSPMGPN